MGVARARFFQALLFRVHAAILFGVGCGHVNLTKWPAA
jgi:hypothetical protein